MSSGEADGSATAGVPLLVHAGRTRVCCVGGGRVAADKLRGLLAAGAAVRVVAPEIVAALRVAADAGSLRWTPRSYRDGDIGDAHVVIAATGSPRHNAAVAAAADAAGRLCVRVDRSPGATAAFMGTVDRDPLLIAVSTSGVAPALTRLIRADIDDTYGPEWASLAALCGQLRDDPSVRAALHVVDAAERRARWHALYRTDILDLIRAGRLESAREAAYACLLSSSG